MRIDLAFIPYRRVDLTRPDPLVQVRSVKTEQEALDLVVRFFGQRSEGLTGDELEEAWLYNAGLSSQIIDSLNDLGPADGSTCSYVAESYEIVVVFQRNLDED